MIAKGMMTSLTAEWATPKKIFDSLNEEFRFTLDPCCTHENAKCERHFTKEDKVSDRLPIELPEEDVEAK